MKQPIIQTVFVLFIAVGMFTSCGKEKAEPTFSQVALSSFTDLSLNDLTELPNPAASEQYAISLFDLKEDGDGLTEKELRSIGDPAKNEDLLFALLFVEKYDRNEILWSWDEPAAEVDVVAEVDDRSHYGKWKWTGDAPIASMYGSGFKKWPANQMKSRYTDPCGEIIKGGPVYQDCFYLCDGCPPPFVGSIEYVRDSTITLQCNCTAPYFIGNYFGGTGNITHMGEVYSESIPCIEYIFSGSDIIGYTIDSQCNSFFAENGDELYGETDSYTMMLDFNCFCQFAGTATVNFDGGTGRFENATGTATIEVVNDLATGIVTATFDGEIDY